MSTNILITSVGRRAYIVNYFKHELAGNGKVHACNNTYTLGTQEADAYFIAPAIYSENYIDAIISYCKKNDIHTVFSLFDIDLLVLAQNEQAFLDAGITLILAPADFVKICNDKYSTSEFALSLGLNTPKTYKCVSSVLDAIEEGEVSWPIIMKPRWGMASMGIHIAYNEDELRVLTEVAKREIAESYLRFETSLTPKEPIIYQQFLVGKEFGLDVINDLEGNFVAAYAKQKVTMRSGETDIGLTVSIDPFLDAAKAISGKSKHKGILSVDVFLVDEMLYLVEMNCRISGHYPISHVAGVNYPKMLLAWLRGEKAPDDCFCFEKHKYITKDLVPLTLEIPASQN